MQTLPKAKRSAPLSPGSEKDSPKPRKLFHKPDPPHSPGKDNLSFPDRKPLKFPEYFSRFAPPTVLLLLGIILYFTRLGEIMLWDADEALYTRIAREMLLTGDYITTQWNGKPWFCHPPLGFWMTILSSSLFGWNELGARFPSALFGILNIILVYYHGASLENRKTGWYAALIFAVSLQIWLQSRIAILDMPFLFFINASFYFYYRGTTENKPAWYTGFWIASALAVLTKGPVGVILPLIYSTFDIVVNRNWKKILPSLCAPLNLLLFVFIAAPWFVQMSVRYGEAFNNQVFHYFFLNRIVEPVMNQDGPTTYYIPFLLTGFLPWTIFLPILIHNLTRHLRDPRLNLLMFQIVFTFVFFSLSATKRPNYILFLYPTLSLALARVIIRMTENREDGKLARLAFSLLALSFIISPGILRTTAAMFYPKYWHQYGHALLPLNLTLIVGGLVIFITSRRSTSLAFHGTVFFSIVFYLVVLTYSPFIQSLRPEKAIVSDIRSLQKKGDKIALNKNFGRQFTLTFYSDIPIQLYETDEKLLQSLDSRKKYFVVMHEKDFDLYNDSIRIPITIIRRQAGLILFHNDKPDAHSKLSDHSMEIPGL